MSLKSVVSKLVLSVLVLLAMSGCEQKNSANSSSESDKNRVAETAPTGKEDSAADTANSENDINPYAEQAHMFVLPPGKKVGAAYMRLVNPTSKAVTLAHVSASIAGAAEVHYTKYENGMMKMRRVPHLMIPPKGHVDFIPGGHHVMLFDIEPSPSIGENFTVTFELTDGQKIDVTVAVRQRS